MLFFSLSFLTIWAGTKLLVVDTDSNDIASLSPPYPSALARDIMDDDSEDDDEDDENEDDDDDDDDDEDEDEEADSDDDGDEDTTVLPM